MIHIDPYLQKKQKEKKKRNFFILFFALTKSLVCSKCGILALRNQYMSEYIVIKNGKL